MPTSSSRARKRSRCAPSCIRWNTICTTASDLKTTCVGNTSLKAGSECSFRTLNSASSPVFASSCLPRLRFQRLAK
ncbi:MAG TPA: hypothetical protein DCR66_00225 [Pseudomonas sp.]|nr:hypothetical protein [Pseudomonas sp.]